MSLNFSPPTASDLLEPPEFSVLRDEALTLIETESVLAELLGSYFPAGGKFASALALRLGDALHSSVLDSETLTALFNEILILDPTLATAGQSDLFAIRSRDPSCGSYLHAFLNLKGFHALQAHRMAHALWRDERHELASWLSNLVSARLGVDIHPAARIGAGVMLDHASGLVIGETAVVEDHVSVLQNVTLGGTGKTSGDRHPKVRQGVMIGAGSKVIGNIEIGANSKIAAGSVVLKNVPANCTVAGIPAQIVRIHNAKVPPADTMDQTL